MGTYYYLARNDTKELFELGKSALSMIYPYFSVVGSIPATVEDWKQRYLHVLNDPPTDHDDAKSSSEYGQKAAEALFSFVDDGKSFYLIDDGGDQKHAFMVGGGYRFVGTIYYLDNLKRYAEYVAEVNDRYEKYRKDPVELRDGIMDWKAVNAVGGLKELGPPR